MLTASVALLAEAIAVPSLIHWFPVEALEVSVTLPPVQKLTGPLAEIVGVAGRAFTVTLVPAETNVHPPVTVALTVYTPVVVAEKLALVAPDTGVPFFSHCKGACPLVVSVTLPPEQKVVAPPAVKVGGRQKANPLLLAVPPGVVILTLPLVPEPTTAVTVVADTLVKEVALVPPKVTAVVPDRLVPVMVTVAPAPAPVGVKELIAGAGIKVKPANPAVPPSVVTLRLPLEPAPTTAVMVVAETRETEEAAVPPKVTVGTPEKLVPVMVITAPLPALVGVKELTVGAGIKVNPANVAVPPAVVRLNVPVAP